ncbi:MAG TPA: GNAT family N-acetyltransferase [Saprospiraceae bacterium]|nr:GNAT family N-acetyltransferase [Saprospiraceae bacterium]
MNIHIRTAVKSDCPQLMKLIRELAEFERAADQVTVTPQQFEESGFGDNPVWWAFVAEVDEKIVGMALYYVRYSTWKGRRLYLEDIIVTQEMRGHKIGSQLMEVIINEAKVGDYTGLMWQALDWNQPAIEFYISLGAKADSEWINFQMDV